jgi:hypothetical protein
LRAPDAHCACGGKRGGKRGDKEGGMAKLYPNQITVRVWRNFKKWGKLPTGHFGHASVTLSGGNLTGTVADPRRRLHISFWPGEAAGIGKSGIRAQSSSEVPYSLMDKMMELGDLTSLRLEVGYRKKLGIAYPLQWEARLFRSRRAATQPPRWPDARSGQDAGQGGAGEPVRCL